MAKSNRAGSGPQPSQEEIAQRAYELYLQRGSVPGHETDDWLQAEAELSAEAQSEQPEETQPARRAAAGTSRRETSAATRRSLRQ